jgi:hypothetical protein
VVAERWAVVDRDRDDQQDRSTRRTVVEAAVVVVVAAGPRGRSATARRVAGLPVRALPVCNTGRARGSTSEETACFRFRKVHPIEDPSVDVETILHGPTILLWTAKMVRRLPVVQNTTPEDVEAAERPRAQWVAIGAGLNLSIWIPLALCAAPIGRVLTKMVIPLDDPTSAPITSGTRVLVVLAQVVPQLVAFAAAAFASGALVGRFGGLAKTRDATLATLLAAFAAAGIGGLSGALRPWLVVLATSAVLGLFGAAFGALGGRFGERRRPRL